MFEVKYEVPLRTQIAVQVLLKMLDHSERCENIDDTAIDAVRFTDALLDALAPEATL